MGLKVITPTITNQNSGDWINKKRPKWSLFIYPRYQKTKLDILYFKLFYQLLHLGIKLPVCIH